MNENLLSLSCLALVRWTARIGSILSIGLLLLFFVGEGFRPSGIEFDEWIGLLFFPFGILTGLLIAWRHEGIGGSITILSLLAFYFIYGWLLNKELWQGGWFIVFASPGFLFFIYWLLKRSNAEKSGLRLVLK